MNIKAIVFDIDDTLVRTIAVKWDALKKTAKKYYNMVLDDGHIRRFWGLPFEKMLSGVFSCADSLANIKKHYIEVSRKFPMKEQIYAVKSVKYLKQKYLIAALTSSSRLVIFNDLKDAGFDINDFFYIQTAEDTSFHKPDPRVFKPVLKHLEKKGVKTSQIIYVGDSLRDYESARKTGMRFLAVTTGLTSKQEFIQGGVGKKNIFDNLLELSRSV